MLKFLLKNGGNPNSSKFKTSHYTLTTHPLIKAIKSNQPNFVKLLLKTGADPNCKEFKHSDDFDFNGFF